MTIKNCVFSVSNIFFPPFTADYVSTNDIANISCLKWPNIRNLFIYVKIQYGCVSVLVCITYVHRGDAHIHITPRHARLVNKAERLCLQA